MRVIIVLLPLIVLASANTIIPLSPSVQNYREKEYEIEETDAPEMAVVGEEEYEQREEASILSRSLKADDPVRSEVVQNLLQGAFIGGFSAVNLLESLQPSDCLHICLDEVTSMLGQPFAGQRSFDDPGSICSHLDVFQRCLHHNSSCKNALLGITTTIFDYLCTVDQEALEEVLPCLYRHSVAIYYTCDNQCNLGELLSKASRESNIDVINLQDSNGSKLLEVTNLDNLCSSSKCFVNCTQQEVERDCSLSRSPMLQKIVAAVVNHTMTLNPAPGMKSSDAYTLLISSVLPRECHRLKLLPEDVLLTTEETESYTDFEHRNGEEVVKHKNADDERGEAIRSILDNNSVNQTGSIYVQTFPLNGHQMKLQCQMIDLETGNAATVADVATMMTAAAKNIFHEFGLRSADDEVMLEDNVKDGSVSGISSPSSTKVEGERNEVENGAPSLRLFTCVLLSFMLSFLVN